MSEIFITGHRNPDLDSVSAAWCYAHLKNIVDQNNTYIPIRIGHVNDMTKDQFQKAGVKIPRFMRDVRPKVADVVISDAKVLDPEEPIYSLVATMKDWHSSVVPILHGTEFIGLLSLDEITSFFLRENAGKRPRYHFNPANFSKVIPGEFIHYKNGEPFDAPIMIGAMEFDVYRKRLLALVPELPLLVVGNRPRHLAYAIENQFPAIVVTGMEEDESLEVNLSSYRGVIYKSYEDTAQTIRLLRMSIAVRHMLVQEPPRISVQDLFDDAKRLLSESEFRGLPVFDEGRFVGFVTRRCFLERPRKKVALVDHNELRQSIEGLEDADVVEIIDHHRLAAEKTRNPIFVASEPVGSTCTVVYHQFLRWGVPVDETTARLLLAGIVSDTALLKSPTTTDLDVSAVQALCTIAHIGNFKEFGEQVFTSASVLTKADPLQVIESDFKVYEEKSVRFGIGQVEVTTLETVDEVKQRYLDQLETVRQKLGLDWAMLMITDVIKEESVLLTTSYPKQEKALAYPRESDGVYILKGVLSRKKQLLPEILRVLEEGR